MQKEFNREEVLIEESNPRKVFFILQNGRVGLFRQEELLGELGPNDFIGEIALLAKTKWHFSLKAFRKVRLFVFSEKQFFDLILQSPHATLIIMQKMTNLLECFLTKKPLRYPTQRIGLISLGNVKKSIEFVHDLQKHLELTSMKIYSLEKFSIEQIATASDRIFLAIPIDELPRAEEWIHTCDPHTVELIFLHDHPKIEQGRVSLWLQKLGPLRVHHIRRGNNSDYDRFVRWVTGKSLSIVLGSGWSKTVAQIGILQAFHDANIPIDAIGGVGLGALIGALYALGKSPREIFHILRPVYRNVDDFLDYTFPFLSLIEGKRIQEILDEIFQQLQIEDLWLPYFCTATDLRTTQEYVYRSGSIAKAVRASLSVPGVFPPVNEGNHLLVDGSLSNLLPIDIMTHFTEGGKICAVDVDPLGKPIEAKEFSPVISGWKYLFKSYLPFVRVEIPNIFHILLRTTLLSSVQKKDRIFKELKPDLVLAPPLETFSDLDFDSFDAMYEAGYQYGLEKLRDL